jgi:hypothetical protein
MFNDMSMTSTAALIAVLHGNMVLAVAYLICIPEVCFMRLAAVLSRGLFPEDFHQHRRSQRNNKRTIAHVTGRMHNLLDQCTPQEMPREASRPRDRLHRQKSVMIRSTACCTTAKTWQRLRCTAKQEKRHGGTRCHMANSAGCVVCGFGDMPRLLYTGSLR